MRSLNFFNLLNPSSRNMALDPASSRNEYQGDSWGQARKADKLTAICEPMSRRCGSLDPSQPYGPSLSITGTALPFYRNN
jgi:hypothetical protein